MSDIYGSGLTFDRAGGAEGAPGLPQGSGAPLDLSPQQAVPEPVVQGPAPQQPAKESGGFGSAFGAHYTQPDPQTAPLDQAASLLEQRVKRASSIATNPIAQIFAPEQVQAAREFVPKAAEELQKINTQKSGIAAGRIQARMLGLDPGEVSDAATHEDRMTVAVDKALKGNMQAFQGIQAVAPERAAAIAPQVYETVARHLDKAQFAFDSLASMQNEGRYQDKVRQLHQDGTLTDLEAIGLKLPASFEAFSSGKAMEARALREARIGINTIGQKLEERNTYQPMEKKEQEAWHGRLTSVYGDAATGKWSRNAASNTPGLIMPGVATVDQFGKTGNIAAPEQRKAIKEEWDGAVPKTELDKYREFNRTYKLATEDAKGNKFADGKINDNPNVQQGIAEGLAAMLRGGHGGANVGLLNIETSKRGYMQALLDRIKTEKAGTLNVISGKDTRPYLTNLTQQQQRDVLDVLKGYNDTTIGDRGTEIAKRAGAMGLDATAFGLGKDEAAGAIAKAIEEGRQAQIERMRPNFQPIGGGDGVWQVGAQRPGADASALPPGAQQANQLPGAQPLATPVQQANGSVQPNAPVPVPQGGAGPQQPGPSSLSPQPGGTGQPPSSANPGQPTNGGGGQPVRIASADVALPPGLSPAYVKANQRIESGNERDPWKAGNTLSSAGGAFQIIDSTWKANKPPGAPDKAKDATPAQQVQTLANIAAKDTATLNTLRLPVNDTSLYIMHNLGAGGGASLLKSDPSADARSIVGEAAAKNNPTFFKGRPTVATVLQRYADAVNAPDDAGDGPKPKPGAGGATATVARTVLSAIPGGAGINALWSSLTTEQKKAVGDAALENAPAIGSTAGAVAGGIVGGLPGAVAGGAAGGGAGQSLKDYLKGNTQSPLEIAKQTALGGVLGVVPVGRPVLGAATRMLGAGAIEGGAKAVEGGDAADVAAAASEGVAAGAVGEAFGRALGMAGHKVYNMFAPDAKKAVQTAAKTYAEATETLATQQPKIPSATGAAVANPKYEAAEAAKTKAEQTLKDAGLNPEEAAYAHKVSSDALPPKKQDAEAMRPSAIEKEKIGQGYQQIENEVANKGVGAVKETAKPLQDGPVTAVISGKVSATHKELAEHVEKAITAPAANWQEKWTQLKQARSDLLEAERDALGSMESGKSKTAKDMRTLADTVRVQQEKAAKYVFGPREGELQMMKLRVLDARYQRLMSATENMDLAKAARMTGEAGREAEKRFVSFAHGDPQAIAAYRAMRGVKGGGAEATVPWTVAGEGLPVVGKVIKVWKLGGMMREWAQERAAGSPVTFADLVKMPNNAKEWQSVRDILGSAGARTAVQGEMMGGASQ